MEERDITRDALHAEANCSAPLRNSKPNEQRSMKEEIAKKHVFARAGSWVRSIVATLGLCALCANAQVPAGYVLNWSDEFNGTSVDTTKWRVPNGENHFGALSDPSLVSVSGGLLRLDGG